MRYCCSLKLGGYLILYVCLLFVGDSDVFAIEGSRTKLDILLLLYAYSWQFLILRFLLIFLKSIFILCIIGYLLLLLLSNVNETQLIAILIPVCYSFDPYVLELVSSFFYVYTDIDQTDFHRSEPISCVDLYYVNTIFLVSFTLLSSYKTTSRCLIFNYVF